MNLDRPILMIISQSFQGGLLNLGIYSYKCDVGDNLSFIVE